MSPLKSVTIKARRGFVILAVLAVPALPIAAWIVSSSVSENAELARAIQDQRRDSILAACQEQNMRHDKTIETLDALLVKRVGTAGPRERVRLRASRASTVALIEALAPRRDCRALVARSAPVPASQ